MADGPVLDGFWLPAIGPDDLELQEVRLGPGALAVRVPKLDPQQVTRTAESLRAARAASLRDRPVERLLETIADAAGRLTRPGGAFHSELLSVLPGLTGYSRRMIEIGLERMAEGWTFEALRGSLAAEFDGLDVLDDYVPRPGGGWQRAFGPALVVQFFSGNVPGISVSGLMRALAVKSACLAKTAMGEPYLSVAFARAVAEVDADLARCLAVAYWPGGSEELEAAAIARAGVVVAYGGDETVTDIRRRLPASVRFVAYPNRVGAGILTARALERDAAEGIARAAAEDVVSFDQQGCVSPHLFYVQNGGDVAPEEFAELLAAGLSDLSDEIPRGTIEPGESMAIHQARAQAEMRGATVLASEGDTRWTVILEARSGFEPSPLNRLVYVRPISGLDDALEALAPVGPHLQTVVLAGSTAEVRDLATSLGELGATRLVPPGQAAWPGPRWHHDGRFKYLDLVRFVDLEPGPGL